MQSDASHSKAQRLSRITHLLYRNPHGLTAQELARLCSVTQRTVQRHLHDLEEMGIPLWDDDAVSPPRYGIIAGYYLPPIHLTLDDALALFLAARLLARYADGYDPHIAQALAKLAGILPEEIARHVHTTIRVLANRPDDERFVCVLGVLALGWATGRKVHIQHQASGSPNIHEYLFCPYFIEPSGVGNATYAIGYSSYFEDLHTFKVERIIAAELSAEHYTVPEDFDGPALLQSAWGIMYGEDLQEIVLRFAPSATRRVQESCWHPSQSIENLPDGGCILRLKVAHPEEMMYWIRGWGAQVEVLVPAWMRAELCEAAQKMMEVYAS
jgi:predicted DNA-binding transcriptional regulator YafY